MESSEAALRLRPHHLIDIFKHHGNGRDLSKPHPYGHAQHIVAMQVQESPDVEIEFVCENDDICKPCRHRRADNTCEDVLSQISPPLSKQQYNDELDKRIFTFSGLKPGHRMSACGFLSLLLSKMPGIIPLATHPRQDVEYTKSGLLNSAKDFGVLLS